MTDDAELRLHHKRAWLDRHIEKAMRRKPYVRLPAGHPDFDAEDLPRLWQRWLAEGVGGLILTVFMFAACWFAYYVMPNPLPDWLDSLSSWLSQLRSRA